jgi:hypothetical protein
LGGEERTTPEMSTAGASMTGEAIEGRSMEGFFIRPSEYRFQTLLQLQLGSVRINKDEHYYNYNYEPFA